MKICSVLKPSMWKFVDSEKESRMVAVPRYYREDRVKELEDREKFLEALVEKYSVPRVTDAPPIPEKEPFTEEEAIAMLQVWPTPCEDLLLLPE
eukprot:scaffold125075_cov36-Prasinocladus_malaysianus.AAC.2